MNRVWRATGNAPAAVCVLKLLGPNSEQAIQKHWQSVRGTSEFQVNIVRYGNWRSSTDTLGEGVVVCRTADHEFEIHCHGGSFAAQRILDDLRAFGFQVESDDHQDQNVSTEHELTLDEIDRDAWLDLRKATTPFTAQALLDQAHGALRIEFEKIQNLMSVGKSHEANGIAEQLIARYAFGKHFLEPYRVVLCGPPNVGKSSLLNKLLGYHRVIVHETPGTTRDAIRETTSIHGLPVMLIDTAGFRDSVDEIERSGMEAAKIEIDSCDLLLLLVSADIGWTERHQWLLDLAPDRTLCVGTKGDLVRINSSVSKASLWTSSHSDEGIELLLQRIRDRLSIKWEPGMAIPFRRSHVDWLKSVLNNNPKR